MSIKLIAIDIDGTLLDSNNQLQPTVIEAIQQKSQAGVKVVLCSGRPLLGLVELNQQLGLTTDDDFTISYNGALVTSNRSKKTFVEHGLSHNDYLKIEALSRQLGLDLHVEDRDYIYTANPFISPYTVVESSLTTMPIRYLPVEDMTDAIHISKMMMIDQPEKINHALPKIPKELLEQYHFVKSMPFFLEILNKKAGKAKAIQELANILAINQSEIMAIGDNENDLDMLEYAGIGIAMANATPSVKKIANFITLSNDQAGVAHALNTWA